MESQGPTQQLQKQQQQQPIMPLASFAAENNMLRCNLAALKSSLIDGDMLIRMYKKAKDELALVSERLAVLQAARDSETCARCTKLDALQSQLDELAEKHAAILLDNSRLQKDLRESKNAIRVSETGQAIHKTITSNSIEPRTTTREQAIVDVSALPQNSTPPDSLEDFFAEVFDDPVPPQEQVIGDEPIQPKPPSPQQMIVGEPSFIRLKRKRSDSKPTVDIIEHSVPLQKTVTAKAAAKTPPPLPTPIAKNLQAPTPVGEPTKPVLNHPYPSSLENLTTLEQAMSIFFDYPTAVPKMLPTLRAFMADKFSEFYRLALDRCRHESSRASSGDRNAQFSDTKARDPTHPQARKQQQQQQNQQSKSLRHILPSTRLKLTCSLLDTTKTVTYAACLPVCEQTLLLSLLLLYPPPTRDTNIEYQGATAAALRRTGERQAAIVDAARNCPIAFRMLLLSFYAPAQVALILVLDALLSGQLELTVVLLAQVLLFSPGILAWPPGAPCNQSRPAVPEYDDDLLHTVALTSLAATVQNFYRSAAMAAAAEQQRGATDAAAVDEDDLAASAVPVAPEYVASWASNRLRTHSLDSIFALLTKRTAELSINGDPQIVVRSLQIFQCVSKQAGCCCIRTGGDIEAASRNERRTTSPSEGYREGGTLVEEKVTNKE